MEASLEYPTDYLRHFAIFGRHQGGAVSYGKVPPLYDAGWD